MRLIRFVWGVFTTGCYESWRGVCAQRCWMGRINRGVFLVFDRFMTSFVFFFFFQAEDGIRDGTVTGVQTCALPISEPDPVEPDPQPEPEPWCGLESQIAATDIPAFGEDWTNGHPFEVGDTVGYLDVVRWEGWSTLTVRTFNENNVERDYSLSARMIGPVYAYCDYYVNDVLVDNPRVYILHSVTCTNVNGTTPQRWVELSVIDTEYGTDITFGFWELAQEMYENYQLGLDNGNLLVGSYNVFSSIHSVRPIHRDN